MVFMTTSTKHIINYEVKDGVVLPVEVTISGGDISVEEATAYVKRGFEKHADKVIDAVDVTVDGEYVDLQYHFSTVPFERIRRITGYLVGTLDRFNNAKRAEVEDRVKHSA